MYDVHTRMKVDSVRGKGFQGGVSEHVPIHTHMHVHTKVDSKGEGASVCLRTHAHTYDCMHE